MDLHTKWILQSSFSYSEPVETGFFFNLMGEDSLNFQKNTRQSKKKAIHTYWFYFWPTLALLDSPFKERIIVSRYFFSVPSLGVNVRVCIALP
jgi:hypothetical protein